MGDLDAAARYVVAALAPYEPERIILFGSRVTGGARPWSDLDILVVKDDPRRPIERMQEVTGLLYDTRKADVWEHLPPLGALVFTPSEIAERIGLGDPFFRDMVAGRVVYERDAGAA